MAPFDILISRSNSVHHQALPIKSSHIVDAPPSSNSESSADLPYEIYDGGYEQAKNRGIQVRIANGTAGQIGLLRAWADAFIQDMVMKGEQPFQVAWYLGDSTDSLALLASGVVDMALTYVPAAEKRLMDDGLASRRKYAFCDKFALVGPSCNPAGLDEKDSVYAMFNKIAVKGDADVECPPDPDVRPAVRFLSRCDKSATNIRESQIFLSIGKLPWGHDYSRWYHQYIRFPREALRAAAALSEYTLIDYGAWLSAPPSVRASMHVFKMGSSDAADDILVNPAHLLYSSANNRVNNKMATAFYDWALDPNGGQNVTLGFTRAGKVLYTKPPCPQGV